MIKTRILILLAGVFLLLCPTGLRAEEQPAAEKPLSEKPISPEDRKVIALMELLQKMEMLKDFQVLNVGEDKE